MAVAESYDPTLWQEIITNIIHSAVVMLKGTQHHEGIFPKKREVKEKREVSLHLFPVRNADAEHFPAATLKIFLSYARLDSNNDSCISKKRLPFPGSSGLHMTV